MFWLMQMTVWHMEMKNNVESYMELRLIFMNNKKLLVSRSVQLRGNFEVAECLNLVVIRLVFQFLEYNRKYLSKISAYFEIVIIQP